MLHAYNSGTVSDSYVLYCKSRFILLLRSEYDRYKVYDTILLKNRFFSIERFVYCNPIPTIITGPKEVIDSPWPAVAAS